MPDTILVTGSAGLIGSEAVRHYNKRAARVIGIDNNMREHFFGPDGDTSRQRRRLEETCENYRHVDADIRDRGVMMRLFEEVRPDVVIHCAAQPSHDLAARMPFEDFDTNAGGTLTLLEATRLFSPDACFVFMSTNKVYGDAPNEIALRELPTRWDFADPAYAAGINEQLTVDQSKHSLFGASKLAADVMVQEYGRYFGMKTVCFRGGCLTGIGHSAAELHGFLAYLARAVVERRPYTIFGYKGKQVRDQIHSRDVVGAFDAFIRNPRPGAVYNLGGGKGQSISMLEAIDRLEHLLGQKLNWRMSEENRAGDHICYYSDLSRMRHDYPEWDLTVGIDAIFDEFAAAARAAQVATA